MCICPCNLVAINADTALIPQALQLSGLDYTFCCGLLEAVASLANLLYTEGGEARGGAICPYAVPCVTKCTLQFVC